MAVEIRSLEWLDGRWPGLLSNPRVALMAVNGFNLACLERQTFTAKSWEGAAPHGAYYMHGPGHQDDSGQPNGTKCQGWRPERFVAKLALERIVRDLLATDTWLECHICGAPDHANYTEPTKARLLEYRRCHTCDFWECIIAIRETRLIVNGRCYVVEADRPKGYQGFIGCGGARYDIEWSDGRRQITHNLWVNGLIPERFRDRLPDNARFLAKGEGGPGMPYMGAP